MKTQKDDNIVLFTTRDGLMGTTIVLMVWFTPVLVNDINAFCIFNCVAEDLKIRLQANVVG